MLVDEAGHPIYRATMPRNRMKFLQATISFDNKKEREKRWPEDRFAAARPIFELFNSNLSKYLIPPYLSIDKTLYPMRHQIGFRRYNPSKPHRYGLLLKSLNDASFSHRYKASPYAGKPS